MGKKSQWSIDPKQHPHEAELLKLDCSKTRTLLGWATKLSVDTALEWTAEWYKIFLNENRSVLEFSEKQINSYELLFK